MRAVNERKTPKQATCECLECKKTSTTRQKREGGSAGKQYNTLCIVHYGNYVVFVLVDKGTFN